MLFEEDVAGSRPRRTEEDKEAPGSKLGWVKQEHPQFVRRL